MKTKSIYRTSQEAKDVLFALLYGKKVLDEGRWVKHRFSAVLDGKLCHCALGAARGPRRLMYLDAWGNTYVPNAAGSVELLKALRSMGHIGGVPSWNDAPNRTIDDVKDLYAIAIKNVRREVHLAVDREGAKRRRDAKKLQASTYSPV